MHVIPFGDRILLKRKKVGEKIGSIYLSDGMKESNTDLADVVQVPESTFADKEILDNAEQIVKSLTEKAKTGDSDALITLLRLNEFIKIKSIKEGDSVMLGKYIGTDFLDGEMKTELTIARNDDVIGLVAK